MEPQTETCKTQGRPSPIEDSNNGQTMKKAVRLSSGGSDYKKKTCLSTCRLSKTQTLPVDPGHDFIHAVREEISDLVKVEVKIEDLRSTLR